MVPARQDYSQKCRDEILTQSKSPFTTWRRSSWPRHLQILYLKHNWAAIQYQLFPFSVLLARPLSLSPSHCRCVRTCVSGLDSLWFQVVWSANVWYEMQIKWKRILLRFFFLFQVKYSIIMAGGLMIAMHQCVLCFFCLEIWRYLKSIQGCSLNVKA